MRKLTLTLTAAVAIAVTGLSVGAGSAAAFGLRTCGGPDWIDFRSGVIVDGDCVELTPSHFEFRPIAHESPVHW